MASGLADHLVLTISDDPHGHLLLGTNRGVIGFDPKARDGAGAVVARFDRASGAIASEVSHSSAFARDEAGRYWFGFKGGVTVFTADFDPPRQRPTPPLLFERLATRGGREIRAPFSGRLQTDAPPLGAEPIVLAHEDSNLRIEVRALTLSGEGEVRYQFRLDGFENAWSEPQGEAFRDYTNLDPGSYRLQARAGVGNGAWSGPVELVLEVQPAWYQRRLVSLLGGLALLAAVFGAATFRTRSIGVRNRALERDVIERTDDLARYARALEEHAHALDRANERIRLADRHRSEFLAKMSHELRTPLTSVLGFAALLSDGLASALEPRHARYLENIRESGNQLLRLINNLLDQAKIEAGRMDLQLEPARLDAIIESALSMMEGYGATRGVSLRATLASEVPVIVVDVAKLRQAILNLLSNAIKFSGKGSEVEVRTRFLPAAQSALDADAYEIVVADQGPGIGPEDQERIFEPFRQLAPRGETVPGTGLGLSIARQFVALLGGGLEVESAVGNGAAFRIRLPVDATVHARGSRREVPAAHTVEPGAQDRPRVVVLEPDRGRFTVVAGDLERQGFLAVRAPDSEEGRRMLRELRPAVVAVDINPARLEAWTALLTLERDLARAGTPLVLFAFAAGSERGVAASFERLLHAPASGNELVAALQLATLGPVRLPAEGRRTAAGGRPVWLASGPRNAPPDLDADLSQAGFPAQRPAMQSRALALAASGEFGAIVVDLADRHAGGFEMAVDLQSGRAAGVAWIALAPEELTSSERKRLVEFVESAAGSAGAAVAAAAIRVTPARPERSACPAAGRENGRPSAGAPGRRLRHGRDLAGGKPYDVEHGARATAPWRWTTPAGGGPRLCAPPAGRGAGGRDPELRLADRGLLRRPCRPLLSQPRRRQPDRDHDRGRECEECAPHHLERGRRRELLPLRGRDRPRLRAHDLRPVEPALAGQTQGQGGQDRRGGYGRCRVGDPSAAPNSSREAHRSWRSGPTASSTPSW